MRSDGGSAVVGFALGVSLLVTVFVFVLSLVQVLNAQSQLNLATNQAARAAARYQAPAGIARSTLKNQFNGKLQKVSQQRFAQAGNTFIQIHSLARVDLSWLPISIPIDAKAKALAQL